MFRVEVVQPNSSVIGVVARADQPFQHVLFEARMGHGKFVCAGAGFCGRCAIRFLSSAPSPCADDQARLSPEALRQGWRLACRHLVTNDCRIEAPTDTPVTVPSAQGELLGVDIGTTRIKWAVMNQGKRSSEYAMINPQMAVGGEIMSRLRYALSSDTARTALRESVLTVLRDLCARSGAKSLALAGNSTMISLLLDVPLTGLAGAPYHLPWSGGHDVFLDASLPLAFIPPLLGPFVGADISAGLAVLCAAAPEYPFLLADLGTNAEFVLALDAEHFYACSVPLGPAIEGVGLCCGAVAGEHVLTRVQIDPRGLHWTSDAPPLSGISGTGYISLLAALLRVSMVDEQGHFQEPRTPLAQKIGLRIKENAFGRVFLVEDDVFVAARDVEEFLKVKSAVNVAMTMLVRQAGLTEGDVQRVCLAGALGEYADPADLFTLGFLPECWRGKTQMVGNTALAGTLLAFEREDVRTWLDELPARVRIVDLVARDEFASQFFQAMRFSWR